MALAIAKRRAWDSIRKTSDRNSRDHSASELVDTTGCGDAFIGVVLHGGHQASVLGWSTSTLAGHLCCQL
ncbi:hypothetical protein SETIT_9G229300v2 [Setaria italica]|uniref:Carbohydrate kinase PfkB domain-containing protein n=1 Tax=Setaria italica TaxID=4555 RepID=K4AHN3_SETIT|nr:hypothetical protein SETIT_9G229300v2 [Setaria italica]